MERSLGEMRGVGAARLKALNAAGFYTVKDLVMNLPREYRDMTVTVPICALKAGENAALRVRVSGEVSERRAKKLLITKLFVTDGEDVLPVVWYNQPWLKKQMPVGRELRLYGKPEWRQGVLQLISPSIEQDDGLIPIYRAVTGVPAAVLRQLTDEALEITDSAWPEDLPEKIRQEYGLCERNFALRTAHRPPSKEALNEARRRLAFEDLLMYQTALMLFHDSGKDGIQMDFADDALEKFYAALPFTPTNAQRRVLGEIADDLRSPKAMARMVQGDVGSGKTAVAFAAIALACGCGWQSAMMAPTEVLARQHYDAAKALLEPMGFTVGLLTGSLTQKQHRLAHEAIAAGTWDVIIGTHALITEGVAYARLGLVVTDEQHRFGVRQRSMLSEKGSRTNVLVMSATPIPRTLSLILYGDLDISIMDELPPGRTPVATRSVPQAKRDGMYGFLRAEVQKGRQVYVVCPLVEESEAVDALPAEQVYEDLRTKYLPDLRIELVHGRMKAADKDEVLERFRKGEADVLVSTTVIEVGVNVPNATIMVIENAERFGLAQLHQLRGRVGRGKYESWCFLMSEPNERLRFLCSTNDGFKVAQKDMEIRGPGEMFGTRQSGSIASGLEAAVSDTRMLKETNELARRLTADRNSEESRAVIELARARYADKLRDIAMN